MTQSTQTKRTITLLGFNGHPPLGVNATKADDGLGSICWLGFNGHPPLGVNATSLFFADICPNPVSTGTHPWG